MCDFIQNTNVLPGWGCCQCSSYNGLQRQSCRKCPQDRCEIAIPTTVLQCECGFGMNPDDWAQRDLCPSCDRPSPFKRVRDGETVEGLTSIALTDEQRAMNADPLVLTLDEAMATMMAQVGLLANTPDLPEHLRACVERAREKIQEAVRPLILSLVEEHKDANSWPELIDGVLTLKGSDAIH